MRRKIFWVQFGCNVKTARFWAVFEAKIDENEAFWGIYKGLKILCVGATTEYMQILCEYGEIGRRKRLKIFRE